MARVYVGWDPTIQGFATQGWLQLYPGGAKRGRWAVFHRGVWAWMLVHAMREASHMARLARTAQLIRAQGGTVGPTHPAMVATLADGEFVVDSPEYVPFLEDSRKWLGPADLAYLAVRGGCRACYKLHRATKLDPIVVWGLPPTPGGGGQGPGVVEGGPAGLVEGEPITTAPGVVSVSPGLSPLQQGGGQDTSMLTTTTMGIAPIVVGALAVVGIAAVAAAAWLGTEISEDKAKVEIEKGRQTAKAVLSLEIAKAQIANGKKVDLPKELLDWGEAEKRNTSTGFKVGGILGILAAGGLGGLIGFKAAQRKGARR